jgi:hypothetical protein
LQRDKRRHEKPGRHLGNGVKRVALHLGRLETDLTTGQSDIQFRMKQRHCGHRKLEMGEMGFNQRFPKETLI